MKKRIVLAAALAALCAGGGFAQHFISAEASILGGGARYEYAPTPYFSIGGNVYFNYMPVLFVGSFFGIDIAARWYPFGRRFFTELGVGYGTVWYSMDEYYSYTDSSFPYTYHSGYREEEKSVSGFNIAPGFGWTIDVGKPGGVFISPGIKIPVIIAPTSGIFLSAVLYFGLGWMF